MTTASELAHDLERANTEAVDFAGACTPEQWATVVPGEHWPVAVVVHHIAVGHDLMLDWLGRLRAGEEVPGTSADVDEKNARHAAEYEEVPLDSTVELLRANGARAVAVITALAADDLECCGPFGPAGGRPMTVAQVSAVATRQVRGHLSSAKTALGLA
jgi:hypothetical protein